MKEYSLIVIGTGSAANIIDLMMNRDPGMKVALIDKDDPGGICLTRGCIPSKMLIYPADLLRLVETAGKFGIEVEIKKIDFKKIMNRMQHSIAEEIKKIRQNLYRIPGLDYYPETAEFTSPYTLRVGGEILKGEKIFLCIGSRPFIPSIKGLEEVGYLTSDTLLKMTKLPRRLVIIGGGYIAAEYGHFFSAMGSKVTIIGRNPRFLPNEEPEVSFLAKKEMAEYLEILTNHEVLEVMNSPEMEKKIIARERDSGEKKELVTEEILVAAGRASNNDILHPERANIQVDPNGWIAVNEYLETSQPDIWAFGDADGKYLFKHKVVEFLLSFNRQVFKFLTF